MGMQELGLGYRVGIWGCRVRIWGYRGGDARLQGAGT